MSSVEVKVCANIALVKYWGKADSQRNLPAVGSLSLTLDGLQTHTKLQSPGSGNYSLDGDPMQATDRKRIEDLSRSFNIDPQSIDFITENRFPTAAGLASSASGGAAASVAFQQFALREIDRATFLGHVLRASGSAPRSLLPGFVRLDPESQGIALRALPMPSDWDLRVLIVCTASGRKKHGSRDAMEASKSSDYYDTWVQTHRADLDRAEACVNSGDMDGLFAAMENSTLKMHAVAMTAQPPIFYWNPVTYSVLTHLRDVREQTGNIAGFTMDAGPHVKVFTTAEHEVFWHQSLRTIAGVTDVLVSKPGPAPTVCVDGSVVPWSF